MGLEILKKLIKYISEKGKLLVFTTGIRGGENYEDDTVRLKYSLA